MRDNTMQRDISTWNSAVQDVVSVLAELDEAQWALPTDLPGWRVHDVAAHLAHLESVMAGRAQVEVDVEPAPHIRGQVGQYTAAGVLARATASPQEVTTELVSSVSERLAYLAAHPPTDPGAPADGFGAVMGWDMATLLRNRVLDVWMHEQDIRRAVGMPGGFATAAAAHTAAMMAATLPVVFAKRAQAGPGDSLVLDAGGPDGYVVIVQVGPDGRAGLIEQEPDHPSVRLRLSTQDWLILAGGRRTPEQVHVDIDGDVDLARRVLASLAVTP